MEYLVTCQKRNNLIKNLVSDIDGNTLVLFNYVEKHGEPLYEMINNTVEENRKVFFVHGSVDAADVVNDWLRLFLLLTRLPGLELVAEIFDFIVLG